MVRALPPRLPTGGGVLEESLDLVARSDMALYARRERGGQSKLLNPESCGNE